MALGLCGGGQIPDRSSAILDSRYSGAQNLWASFDDVSITKTHRLANTPRSGVYTLPPTVLYISKVAQ